MAFINAKDVAAIRKELKAEFPNLKFGVKKNHHSSVSVTVKSGTIDFGDITCNGHGQVNQYHLHMTGQHQSLFERMVEIVKTAPIRGEGYWARKGWYDNSDSMTDYFDTAYYFDISVGDWSTPYALQG